MVLNPINDEVEYAKGKKWSTQEDKRNQRQRSMWGRVHYQLLVNNMKQHVMVPHLDSVLFLHKPYIHWTHFQFQSHALLSTVRKRIVRLLFMQRSCTLSITNAKITGSWDTIWPKQGEGRRIWWIKMRSQNEHLRSLVTKPYGYKYIYEAVVWSNCK